MTRVRSLSPGENQPLPTSTVVIQVRSASPVNTSALLLTGAGRVRSDADFVFYNQPSARGVQYRDEGPVDVVTIDTTAIEGAIETIAVTASLDGTGPTSFATAGVLQATLFDANRTPVADFVVPGLTSETAVVCLEVYRRGDVWKVRALGQGYDTGLAGLATAFGITVDDPDPVPQQPRVADPQPWPPTPAPTPPAPAAPVPNPAVARPSGAPMQSELFNPAHAEVQAHGIAKQGSKMCRVGMNGEIMARQGSMVAYQGNLHFEALGAGGIGRMMRQAMTGEGVPLMKVTGQGDLFLADNASEVHLIDLDGSDGLTINGANVLAFDSTLQYNVERMHGAGSMSNAGMFNCVFTGRGRIAITTNGTPVVLNVAGDTFADPQAAVAWSSSLRTSVKTNDSFGLGTLMGRSTGERFTLAFAGQGFVVVQPSEQPPGGMIGGTGQGQDAGVGGMLGGFLGR
ncbi:AIM24 family protein [Gordonia sp. PDNC005]|uniref:AIM24 family protein n=1 Tax=Gordonia sp. PDNC005 TaxID=2811424 RepID=UPI0019628B0D|nr:AIM24 family protein [Gordonia sp. PDNC005]QRY64727.1 AIM24 family protein [Gordonia sp. PDNC005]